MVQRERAFPKYALVFDFFDALVAVTPFRTAVPFWGLNHSNYLVVCPQNGAAVPTGLREN